jgi:hypothetical protein
MAFAVVIDKAEREKFLDVMRLYPRTMYVNSASEEETYTLVFLGEDMEKDALIQETLMEHLDSIKIEETIGGE